MVYLLTLLAPLAWCSTLAGWSAAQEISGVTLKERKYLKMQEVHKVRKSNKYNEVEDNEPPIIQKNSENHSAVEEKGDEEEYNPADSNCLEAENDWSMNTVICNGDISPWHPHGAHHYFFTLAKLSHLILKCNGISLLLWHRQKMIFNMSVSDTWEISFEQ